ncbi:hypothetical protein C6A86_023055 [Mycobacterium sp. ITM-2016-00316]|uniref:hypothetical protein n=1 Tax=Mycobacterium sp. ITM-2016-00316 TaxID=2099695 RepID=UPI000CF96B5D|nr:hypothetical protein [Mycobacterium sp. ITM-2016-00316]WNG81045.1 hypothetical protein C6A86_023055 [Mycobacterium sp. ITM-2016-00316]
MTPDPPEPPADHPRIIRRTPTGSFPALNAPSLSDDRTVFVPNAAAVRHDAEAGQTAYIPRPVPVAVPSRRSPGPATAIAAAVLSILSGWATAVIATDLIAGWWNTDLLFCIAIGFLTAISAAAGIGGLIALLLQRRMGRLLIAVGAAIGLLIFGSLFLAGAKLHPVVYAMPLLPVSAIVLALLPSTREWARD